MKPSYSLASHPTIINIIPDSNIRSLLTRELNNIKNLSTGDLTSLIVKAESDIKQKKDMKNKGWNPINDTPEIKQLMAIADNTSNSYLQRDEARQKAYELRLKLIVDPRS